MEIASSAATADVSAGLPPVGPDAVEQDTPETIDNIIPTRGYHMAPMVALGGSAGSIPALQAFFEKMPADAGLVFVVILHLAPDRSSIMAEMIQRWTTMRVVQAADQEKVLPDRVYVIPPGKLLTTDNGHLRLTDMEREHGRRVAIDLFFRSLADTHGAHAAAVVLSGADGDGTIGIKRIKERGGLTIAQDPAEAEHDSMPRAAIGTGMVDWVLPAAQMPRRIVEYIATEKRLAVPPEEGPQPATSPPPLGDEPEAALREVLIFLRNRTGRDFSYYKRATILRRISRRMQINGLEEMPAYLNFMRSHPGEAGALLKELLISVTNFFRDRDAFAALAGRIPSLFEGKTQADSVRVWVPACATGEEAYSIAMLLMEHARTLELPPALQVFGCDLDDDAIQEARAGVYPEAIAADVSEERLRRFFVREPAGYRVRREVREIVLFAIHDLLKDPPFSRLDLISCRNLLIYLSRDAQARAFDIFHFALKGEAPLFLGCSESIEEGSALFRILDKKNRLYARKPSAKAVLPIPPAAGISLATQGESPLGLRPGGLKAPVVVPPQGLGPSASFAIANAAEGARISWSELHFRLIERFGPPSVLVDRDHDIHHLSESAGRFLQLIGGQPTMNLLRLVNPALRLELRAVLFRAAQSGETTEAFRVPVELEGRPRLVNIRVAPAKGVAPDYMVVTFDARDRPAGEEDRPNAAAEPAVQHMERELEQMKVNLRETVQQYEAGTEELKASNEELQAINEELRSATEELETGREELQSINEELSTVNLELKGKVDELAHANSDLHNLMGATLIATVFLDREMRVMRYTSSAVPIFNFIPGDVGRPLSDLQHRLEYPQMAADAGRVLEALTPVERQVKGPGETYYLARLLPYRTAEDRIAGVVLTFVDITERHRDQETLSRHVEELIRFNQAAVGRETRMIELKKEVNALLARLGEPARYPLDFEEGGA